MKHILNPLLLAGALMMLPGVNATAKQSAPSAAEPQASANPQEKAPSQASSRNAHHHKRSSTTRHHRHHKATAKH